MYNKKSQKGAALIVVLSLLSISLMVGLSSMQSSQIDERLAGNYRASAMAQMAAERGGSYRVLEGDFNVDDNSIRCDQLIENYHNNYELFNKGHEGGVSYNTFETGYYYSGCLSDQGKGFDLIMGQVRESSAGEVGDFFAVSFLLVGGGGGNPFNSPDVESPLVCLKSIDVGCGWNDEDVIDYFDGRTHPVPENFGCNGAGCRTAPEGQEGDEISYNEASINLWLDYLDELEGNGFDDTFSRGNNPFQQGERGDVRFVEISGSVKQASNENTYGVVVVKNGASLELTGTGHHEGLILVEEGGDVSFSNNFNLYGAVVAMGSISISVGNGGQGGVRYSDLFSEEEDMVWESL